MPSVKHRWTAREVRRLIEESPLATPRYELVDGELLVTPSPNWTHQTAVSQLLAALIEYLKHQPVGRASTSPFDVELAPESLVQPDVFVVPAHDVRRLLTQMPARDLLELIPAGASEPFTLDLARYFARVFDEKS